MSAQSPYPGMPGAPPAPAPPARRLVVVFILLFLLLGAVSFFLPLPFLGSGERRFALNHIYNHFREGGFAMWGIVLSQMMVWPVIALLGLLLIRGTRVPGSLLFMAGLTPFGVGVLGAMVGEQKTAEAILGDSIDASQRARILAAGISEASNTLVYGGTTSAFAMYLAAVAAVLALASVDPAPLGPRPKSLAWLAALPVGLVAAVICIGVRVALHVDFMALDGLVIFGVLTAGLWAALGGKVLPALVASGHEDDAGRGFRLLLLAAASLAAAMVFSDRALLAVQVREPLGAISGESVDPSQRARIVAAMIEASRGRPIVTALDAMGCLAAFAPPLLSGLAVRAKVSIGGILAGVGTALLALLALLSGRRADAYVIAAREPFDHMDKLLVQHGIALPPTREMGGGEAMPMKPAVYLKRDGTLVEDREGGSDADRPRAYPIAADASATFEQLGGKAFPALLGSSNFARVGLVLTPEPRHDLTPLGPVAGFLGTDLVMLRVGLHAKLAVGLPPVSSYYGGKRVGGTPPSALAVLPDGDVGRLVIALPSGLVRARKLPDTMPLGDEAGASEARFRLLAAVHVAEPDVGMVMLAPAPGDTVGRITAQLQALRVSMGSQQDELVITLDRAALEAAGDAIFSVRDVVVGGSVSRERVAEALRQRAPMFTGCYAGARKSGVAPPTEVGLHFTIPRTGKPAAVHAEHAGSMAMCIEMVVATITFTTTERVSVGVGATLAFR